MKRLVLVAVAAVAATLTLGTARAGAVDYGFTLTLDVSPSTITMNGTSTASGTLDGPALDAPARGTPIPGADVDVEVFKGPGCTEAGWLDEGYYTTTGEDGSYSVTLDPADFADGPGTYSVQAFTEGPWSPCVPLTIVTALPQAKAGGPIGVFLCYSKFQVVPGVWPWGEAQQLMAGGGYWLPYAVPGNVKFGTNIGDYHLICNPASTQSADGSVLGAGENVYSQSDATQAGIPQEFGPFYHVVGG